MKYSVFAGICVCVLVVAAYGLGTMQSRLQADAWSRPAEDLLVPQGRDVPTVDRSRETARRTATPLPAPSGPLVYGGDAGVSGSANGMIAVTGSYGVGTSVLYVLDTVSKQLAVYEAKGGTRGQRSLNLVGARRIDLDLQLERYNDDSDYSPADLQKQFERRTPERPAEAPRATGSSGDKPTTSLPVPKEGDRKD